MASAPRWQLKAAYQGIHEGAIVTEVKREGTTIYVEYAGRIRRIPESKLRRY